MASRCSPSRFSNVVKNFNDKQREAVINIGFGSLLNLNDIRLRRTLINWLIERYCPQTRSFLIGEHDIRLTKMDVALVMGLRVEGRLVDPKQQNHPVDHLMSYYRARCGQIDVKCLEKLLQTTDSGEDFKRTFVLFALCSLLAPKPRPEVSACFLQCVVDTEKISEYGWGEFVLENLFSELDTYKREGHKYIGGCVVLLQFWYYEHVRVPIEGIGNEPKKFPRLSEWDGSRCLDRDKKEGHLGGYGLGEIIEHISPTPDEASKEVVKMLLALELPINSYKAPEGSEADDGTAPREASPKEKEMMIVPINKESDALAANPVMPNKEGSLSIGRCTNTKKRKTGPDIHGRIAALEHVIEEQRNKNKELNQKISEMERALHSNDERNLKDKEDRITALERAIKEQRNINEELKQRLVEIERVTPLQNGDKHQTDACKTEDK